MNFFKKTKSAHKKAYIPKLHGEDRAMHDWWVMVAVFALCIVLVVVLDGYLFMKVNEGGYFVSNTDVGTSETVATKKTLLDAQNFFDARKKEYDALRAAPPPEIDPSL